MPESKHTRYNRSEKGRARSRRYSSSPKGRSRDREYKERQLAQGLCIAGCGRPVAEAGMTECNEHLDVRLAPERLMRNRRHKALVRRAARHQTTGETIG